MLLYLAVVAPFLLAPAALIPFGVPPDLGYGYSVLIAVVIALICTVDIVRMYRRSPEPRSPFFGMLTSSLLVKTTYIGWIGVLVAVAIINRITGSDVQIFDPAIRQVLNAIGAIILLVASIYYRLSIQDEIRRQRLAAKS